MYNVFTVHMFQSQAQVYEKFPNQVFIQIFILLFKFILFFNERAQITIMTIFNNNVNFWFLFPVNERIVIADNVGRIKRLHGSNFIQCFKLGFLSEIRYIKDFDYVEFIFKQRFLTFFLNRPTSPGSYFSFRSFLFSFFHCLLIHLNSIP